MQPAPTWAILRDTKTGQLIRKYIAAGNSKSRIKIVHQKFKRP